MTTTDPDKPRSWRWEVLTGVLRSILLLVAVQIIHKYILRPVQASSDGGLECAWPPGEEVTLRVYVGPEPIQVKFERHADTFMLAEKTFRLGFDDISIDVKPRIALQSLHTDYYAHIYLTRQGHHPDVTRSNSAFDDNAIAYHRIQLISRQRDNRVGPKPRFLLQQEKEEATDNAPVYMLNPNIHIGIYADKLVNFFPPTLVRLDSSGTRFKPILYGYDDWQLASRRVQQVPLSDVSMRVTVQRLSLRKLQALVAFGEAFSLQRHKASPQGSTELEQVKEMAMETSTWLLVLTLAVTVLHVLFDFLAFKNDLAFWRAKTDSNLQGLSVRTILINAVSQLVILLYLVNERASWLVLGSSALGTILEAWKIKKVIRRVSLRPPHVEFHTSGTATEEHDATATRYLALFLVPWLVAYAAYSLVYERHASWYSFFLSTAVGFVYAFGFVMMTPQLFINYRLKSVAHLPWRAFTYKALNTFIDDLFAFVIRMPTLHRLACFRDDILFVVYLYQRWIYPTDLERVNEFGQSFGEHDGIESGKVPRKRLLKKTEKQEEQSIVAKRTSTRRITKVE